MFTEQITNSPLREVYTSFYTGEVINTGDESLKTTLAMLSHHRDLGSIRFLVNTWYGILDGAHHMVNSFDSDSEFNNNVYIEFYRTKSDDDFVRIKNSIEEYAGIDSIDERASMSLDKFFEQHGADVKFYVVPAIKTTIVFAKTYSESLFHFIQAVIPKLIPWAYTTPLTDKEKQIVYSLTSKSKDSYMEVLNEFVQEVNVNEMRVRSLLDGWEVDIYKSKIRNLENDIDSRKQQLNRYRDEISSLLTTIRDLNIRLNGYRFAERDQNKNGLMELFLSNPDFELDKVEDNLLWCTYKGYIMYWDETEFESCTKFKDSVIYNGRVGTWEDKNRLIRAIFDERRFRIRTCAKWYFDRNNLCMQSRSGSDYSSTILETHMPNPHIGHYSCTYESNEEILNLLSEGNFDMALYQAAFASQQLTFSDSTIISCFAEDLFAEDAKSFIELEDGTCVTPRQAMRILRDEAESETE